MHNVYSVRIQNLLFFLLWFLVAAHNVAIDCGDAILGEAKTCNCTADGDPAPTSFHRRASNGSVLGIGNSYTTALVERTLTDYNFTCVASNGFGPNASNITSFDIKGKCQNINFILGD